MFDMKQVSRKIVSLRKEKNLTQTELADMMGVSFQAVSNWERGNSMPDISKLPQLAELFGCSVDELLNERSGLLHSAMADDLEEYVENNDIPREELEAAVPLLKPGQVEQIADGLLKTNDRNLKIFYPYLDAAALRELADQKTGKGESIHDMLPFLDDGYIGKLARQWHEQGKPVKEFYPFMKKEDLRGLAEQKAGKGESIRDMLPFLDKGFIGELVRQRHEQGGSVNEFYPFMGKNDLRELAEQKLRKGEEINDMLPFLGSDFLRRLVLGRE